MMGLVDLLNHFIANLLIFLMTMSIIAGHQPIYPECWNPAMSRKFLP